MSHIDVHQINDQHTWETFVLGRPEANFLQSWNWGQFHHHLGKKVFYLGVFDQDILVGVALIVKEEAKRGHYLTIAGGPLIDWQNSNITTSLFASLKDLANREHCFFVRLRPQILDTPENHLLIQKLGLKLSPMHLTADLTLQLDLSQTSDQLLSQMRKSTRYDIRRADKLGITVTTSQDPQDIKLFYKIQLDVAHKHHFVPFSYQWLHQQFLSFVADNQVVLFSAHQSQHLLASAFIIFYGQEAVYHYGISTPENRNLPGSHAVLWAAIQEAQSRGITRFNFWGIAPEGKTHHRFAGVSLFKRGFGGLEVAYLPAHDLPTSPLYQATKTFETLRSKLRHLS